jgi:hypothetical protein
MPQTDRAEFLRELDATDERYVRKKLALGGYTGWQTKVAEYWLSERDRERQEQREQHRLAATRKSIFWSRCRIGAGLLAATGTAVLHYLSKW